MSVNQFSDSKGEKLAQRLSNILARLHQGETLDKHQLVKDFDVDVRTIERDLGQRLQGIVERNAEGLWQLARASRSTIPTSYLRGYARLTGTEHLFPDPSLHFLLDQLDIPEPKRTTHVQVTNQEDLGRHALQFESLQRAIELRCECSFVYKGKPRHAQPYRLIHKLGVWYLAAEESGRLKNFSVAKIEHLKLDDSSIFAPKQDHQSYIDGKDDVWFTPEATTVRLRVSAEMAHYFSRRSLLPQQSHETAPNGTLLVTAQINHINQLLPVVRYWLPHVRIVHPLEWHAELVGGLRQALANWEEG